ncbi:MAG TPA: lysine biosynthesis protein LysW [Archangium sp.]|nr:lysine biosynthesis protein LysW [Archangium sp.]
MQLQKQMDAKDVAGINGCPTCAFEITGDGYMEGEVVTCEGCSAELEVIGVKPLRFAEAPEVEEDWGE